MEHFAYAFSVIERIERARTATLVLNEVARASHHFGLDHFIVAGVPAPGKSLEPYVLMHNWPRGWYERYTARDYLHVDPVIRKLRTTTVPVVWSDAPYDPSSDKPGHAVMTEAREFSLNNGLSVPIYTLSGDQAAVSFGGSHFELSNADRKALHLIAIYAHNKAAAFRSAVKSPKNPKLSPREIEILQWIAAGLSSRDIAERLNIAYTTVETHVEHACYKLDSACRTQAVAEAIRARLIP
jgi:LuxR family transcriptional regulator, quorum-sensing system regulator BjaR1